MNFDLKKIPTSRNLSKNQKFREKIFVYIFRVFKIFEEI